MVDKYHDLDSKVKYEYLKYETDSSAPFLNIQPAAYSTDLETGTNTVKRTAEVVQISAQVNAGVNPTVAVPDGTKFAAGQTIIIYDTASPTHIERLVIASISTNDLVCTGTLIYTYPQATGYVGMGYYYQMPANGVVKTSDSRMVMIRRAFRMLITTPAFAGQHLFCRVYMDSIDAAHRILDVDLTVAATTCGVDVYPASEGVLTMPNTVWASLEQTPLVAHNFYFFMWASGATVDITAVEFWSAPGTISNTTKRCMKLTAQCLAQVMPVFAQIGTGSAVGTVIPNDCYSGCNLSVGSYSVSIQHISPNWLVVGLTASALNQLAYFSSIYLLMKGES